MSKKSKYYVVWEGHKKGIYNSWAECQTQITGYKGAKYKSYKNLEEAKTAFSSAPYSSSKVVEESNKKINFSSWSVDAACSGNPGLMEYQGVNTKTKEQLFHLGPLDHSTNNIGEFLAIVHALALQKNKGINIPIYTDSMTAMAWVRNKKVKTTLEKNDLNKKSFELIDRALQWLNKNTYKTKIMKWNTKEWGEIPADFGRK